MSDEALLDRLREIIATIDPVPSGIRVGGRAAFWTADRLRGSRGNLAFVEWGGGLLLPWRSR